MKIIRGQERLILWLTSAALFVLSGLIFINRHFVDRHFFDSYPVFWDLSVYLAAAQALIDGLDPYDSAVLHRLGAPESFHFTSPPAVAWLLKVIAESPLRALLKPTLLTLHFAALIGIPITLGRLFFGREPERQALAAAAFLMLFKGAGVVSLEAANNGTILYWWIAVALIPGLERGRWTSFHIAVLVASIFKPFYIFFWLLPVLVLGISLRQIAIATAGVFVAACFYALPLVAEPTVFQHWLANLTRQTLGQGDLGNNVFAATARMTLAQGAPWLPYAVQLAFNGLLAALLVATPVQGRTRWGLLITAAVFMNPRVLPYDAAIASIPLSYTTALLLPTALSFGLRLAISVSSLTAVLLILPSGPLYLVPSSILFPLLVVTVFVCTYAVTRHKQQPQ